MILSEVGIVFSGTSWPVRVSFENYTTLYTPFPCNRHYRLRVLWVYLTPLRSSAILLSVGIAYSHNIFFCLGYGLVLFPGFPFRASVYAYPTQYSRTKGSHKFLIASLPTCHAQRTPTAPPKSHLYRLLCIGFRCVKNVADCIDWYNDADTASGRCVFPVAYRVLCVRFAHPPLFAFAAVFTAQRSAGYATLDTGGWLNL